MAIGVKVLKRPERQVSYIRATLKGMALTFKHMFQPKVTMQYPEEKSTGDERGQYTITPRWRGTHRMLADEQGRSKCVACGLCPQICPANCIKLVPGEDEEGNRYPLIYEIDEFRCILRLLSGGVSRGGDSRRGALREFGIQPGSLRLRLGAAHLAGSSGFVPVGSVRSQGRMR